MGLEESTTYQMILRKGATRAARRMVLRQGRAKFGDPDPASLAAIEAIEDVDRLEILGERSLHANSWRELLEEAPTGGE